MKELSLHMLDIAQNSIAAGAGHMDLAVEETGGRIINRTLRLDTFSSAKLDTVTAI